MTRSPSGKVARGAQFSPCRIWRYALWRTWDQDAGHVMFIGLNPSTADETTDDQTIRRCVGFARAWGYGGIYMLNLFAFRATDPKKMKVAPYPIGPENNRYLQMYSESAGIIVAAWGTHGEFMRRDQWVTPLLPRLHCLGTTKDGHPKHPLRLRADVRPIPYMG